MLKSVRIQLFAAFGAVLILMAAIMVTGLVKIAEVGNNASVIGTIQLPAVSLAYDANAAALSLERDLRQGIIATGTENATWQASYTAAEKQFADDLVQLKAVSTTPESQQKLEAVTTAFNTWTPLRKQIFDAATSDRDADAKAALLGAANVKASAAVETALDDFVTYRQARATIQVTGSADALTQTRFLLASVGIVGFALTIILAWWLSNRIVSGITDVRRVVTSLADNCATGLAEALDAMSRNDLTFDVQRVTARIDRYTSDEIGQTVVASNKLLDKMVACIESYGKARSGLTELIGQVQAAGVGLADTSAQMGSAAAQTGSAVQQVTMAVQNVATGAQETSRSAQETTSAVSQLSQVIDGIARGATDQARQVQTTSATATQMAAGIEEVATNANQVATASQQARLVAERGGQAVRETTVAMNEIQTVVGEAASKVRELGALGQKIGAVVETIDDIAEQTNLLALNAAIEAARAGEHGKGFAVVADEVRKLAERSGRETKQIAELIAQVQTGTRDAVGAMDNGAAKVELGSQKAAQAGQALDEILKSVQDTVRQVGEIASSSRQMAGGARSVTDSMHSISAVVEESSAATEEMAAQASSVTSSIQSIAAVSEQQSAATEQVSASTEEMSAQVEQMAAQAQELAATAAQLKELVSRFKLDGHAATAMSGSRQPAGRTVTPLRRAA
jgi:methyl-accepting chemotaxis protein